jgi:long-chain acyl-CoA synthetase
MSLEKMTRKFGRNLKTAFKRFILPLLRSLLMGIISILFVHLPAVGYYLITFGKIDEKSQSHKRIRAKLTNPLDPSSPYRAIEVTDELQTTPDEYVQTLADIPDYCLEKYADRETLGVREILDIQDEKQPNGKIFKKIIMGEYKFTTYRETFKRIEDIGRGLLSIGAKPGYKILIFAETRAEWLLTALAALRHGLTIVTLYSTLGEEAVKYGINESQVSIIITSYE